MNLRKDAGKRIFEHKISLGGLFGGCRLVCPSMLTTALCIQILRCPGCRRTQPGHGIALQVGMRSILQQDMHAHLSVMFAPTCMPMASKRARSPSSSSSLGANGPMLTESRCASFFALPLDGGGGGIRPASTISSSIFCARESATADDWRNVCTASTRKYSIAAASINRGCGSASAGREGMVVDAAAALMVGGVERSDRTG